MVEPASSEVLSMRGRRDLQTTMLADVDLDERVPPKHPLRVIKQFADRALVELSPVFDEMYSASGRPSIPPERLLKASLLISLYSVRSEQAFCEELNYHHLFGGSWAWAWTWSAQLRLVDVLQEFSCPTRPG